MIKSLSCLPERGEAFCSSIQNLTWKLNALITIPQICLIWGGGRDAVAAGGAPLSPSYLLADLFQCTLLIFRHLKRQSNRSPQRPHQWRTGFCSLDQPSLFLFILLLLPKFLFLFLFLLELQPLLPAEDLFLFLFLFESQLLLPA